MTAQRLKGWGFTSFLRFLSPLGALFFKAISVLCSSFSSFFCFARRSSMVDGEMSVRQIWNSAIVAKMAAVSFSPTNCHHDPKAACWVAGSSAVRITM